jgi:hypothetical protein
MATTSVWTFRSTIIEGLDPTTFIGFGVEAIDGSIGKVDEATATTGTGYIIVDTGPWIFGKKVMLPAGVISQVDTAEEKVYVNRTKDEIKNAPEFDDSLMQDETYHSRVGTYYGPGGPGYRDDPRSSN